MQHRREKQLFRVAVGLQDLHLGLSEGCILLLVIIRVVFGLRGGPAGVSDELGRGLGTLVLLG